MIPMHYGTFDLSDEPLGMPLQDLNKYAGDMKIKDKILVMPVGKNKQRLLERFPHSLTGKTFHVLDIPDDYQFMDPELVDMLKESLRYLSDWKTERFQSSLN